MELLKDLEAGKSASLIAVTDSDDGPLDAIQSLDPSQLQRLWLAIQPLVESALEAAEPAMQPGAPATDEAVGAALEMLHAVAILAYACISDPEREAPEELVDVATSLHDIIFDLTDPRASQLQSAIVELCEAWYLQERDGRDELVPQTVSYMLVRVLHDLATTADVKRLCASLADRSREKIGDLLASRRAAV